VCPTEAIAHEKLLSAGLEDLSQAYVPETGPFTQFLRSRRSHRNFQERDVPRDVIETLIEAARYAPTGSNVQNVQILVIQDRDRIAKLANLTVEFVRDNVAQVEAKAAELQTAGREIPGDLQYAIQTLAGRKRVLAGHEMGRDPIFHRAPAVMVFHSIPLTSTPKDNGVLVAHTAALTAMTLGVETCYIGYFEFAANKYPPIIEDLGLPAGNVVTSVMMLGYPKYKFQRAVDRKPLEVRWE
jgi:nitroreductase